ncbi:hypothetical protein LSM04_005048 [Trypanosoma melophagium]|uniref:uncharacterized protein n=1 Tax=Trypanosoma melophagium TaxID=715481 RepID=UPI00351A4F84|nr:hypothetical protein LSM04_005048 [Trypanosoma melophagium]
MDLDISGNSPANARSITKDYNRLAKGNSNGLAATAAKTTTSTTTEAELGTETEAVGGVTGTECSINTQSSDTITAQPLKQQASPMSTIRIPREDVIGVLGPSVRPSQGANVLMRSGGLHGSFESRDFGTPALLVQHAGSLSSTLRREQEVMDRKTYLMLCLERQYRRHDPMRGFDRTKQDYVYYNHRSKGCYIPMEKRNDIAVLTYNHMFDYGDGSRFQRDDGGKARANPCVVDPLKGTFKSLTRGSRKSNNIYSKWSSDKASTPRYDIFDSSPHRPKSPRTVSVDLARSLQVSDLRIKPFRKRIVVEDVIATDARSISKSLDGISSVVARGKVLWGDVPESLRRSFVDEQSRRTIARESMYASNRRTENSMNATQGSLYGAPESHSFMDPARSYEEQQQQEEKEGEGVEQKQWVVTDQENKKREQVVFTDHADQVLLGFMDHVRQPVISPDGIPSYCRSHPQTEGEKMITGGGEGGGSSSVNKQQQKEEEEKKKEKDRTDPQLGKERVVLLPPVALAQMREAEWFSPVTSRKPQTGTTPMLSAISLPEPPLPYETSRLHFRRNYDVEEAKPLEGTVRWSSAKGLR